MNLADRREYSAEYRQLNRADINEAQKGYKQKYKQQFEQYKLDNKDRIEKDQISNKNILLEYKQMKRYEADKKRFGLL